MLACQEAGIGDSEGKGMSSLFPRSQRRELVGQGRWFGHGKCDGLERRLDLIRLDFWS